MDSAPDSASTVQIPAALGTATASCTDTPCDDHQGSILLSIRISNCTQIGHGLLAPAALFQHEYPPGTRPAADGITALSIETLLCEQASSQNQTFSPFHLSILGVGIDPPGTSADDATGTNVALSTETNAAELARALAAIGWGSTKTRDFSLDWLTASPNDAAIPYDLQIPAENPTFSARGALPSPNRGGLAQQGGHYFYSPLEAPLHVMKMKFEGQLIGSTNEGAVMTFGDDTYWTNQSWPSVGPGVNLLRAGVSGVLQLEALDQY